VCAVAALTLSACGGNSTAAGGEKGLTTLKVGLFAAADVAPIFVGKEQGFFKEEGLDIQTQMLDGGAAVTAAVIAGDAEIGFSNPVSLVVARSKGLPVTVVAPASAAGKDASEAYAAVLVKKDSPIQSTADLGGKTVAVNALGNILEVTLRNALDKAGVDPQSVKLVEIPFSQMPSVLANGQVDAGFMVEPFVTQSTVDGQARAVAHPYEEAAPSLPGAVYFSTEKFVGGDSETVKAFRRALEKSVKYSNENPKVMRQAVTQFTKISPEVVEKMGFAQLATEVSPEMIQLYVDLTRKYGLVKNDVDIDKLLAGLDK
jgi:NitT/TauT family transport system substrate-binding protein